MIGIIVKQLILILILIYRPPFCPAEFFQEIIAKLKNFLNACTYRSRFRTSYTGRFYFPNCGLGVESCVRWPKSWKVLSRNVFKLMEDLCLIQEVDKPTRHRSKLNLVFTNNNQLIQRVEMQASIITDHSIVVVETNTRADMKMV